MRPLNSSATGDFSLEELPTIDFAGMDEIHDTLWNLSIRQTSWFPKGYQSTSIIDGGKILFAAVRNGRFYLSNSDTLVAGYRPAEALLAALRKIKTREAISFNEEYAVETLWHEMMHERTSIITERRIVGEDPLPEGIVQLTARLTYGKLLAALGGAPAHQDRILKNGLAYPTLTRNLVELVIRAGLTGEDIEKILLNYGQQWLEPFKTVLAERLNTKRVGSLLRYASSKPLADFREKLDVQIRNAPLRRRE